jgi:hypothetical protein
MSDDEDNFNDNDYEEDYYEDDDNLHGDDEVKMVSEFAAFERSGGKKSLLDFIGMKNSFEGETEFQRRRARFSLPPDDQFRYSLQMFINKISEIITIDDNDIDRLNDLIYKIPNIKYKNPQAFLFAYKTLIGNEIDKKRLEKMSKYSADISKEMGENVSTTTADIIRYCRLILANS